MIIITYRFVIIIIFVLIIYYYNKVTTIQTTLSKTLTYIKVMKRMLKNFVAFTIIQILHYLNV